MSQADARVIVRVDGELSVAVAHLSESDVSRLRAGACIPVRERLCRGGQLRWVETRRDLSRRIANMLVLPRGLTPIVREVVGTRVGWVNRTVRAPHSFVSRIPYRPQQREVAEAISLRGQGIVLAATGSGKTGAACATIERVAQRAAVLVPTTPLAAQWKAEIRRFLDVEAAVCTGGRWSDAPVVIATPDTAFRHAEALQAFGLLIVDEVQGFATERRCNLIASIPAVNRLGLTATLPVDHRGAILRATFGPILHEYGVADGIASGVLLAPDYEQVRTAFRANYAGPADWAPLLDKLVSDRARNEQIVDLVSCRCAGATTLVISFRLAHLDVLREMLGARGMRTAILSGESPPEERARVLAAARAGELDVLLGSTVADEGVDIPGLSALILAFPGKAEGRLLQRIGRVVRAAPGKTQPRVFDLVDDVGPLRRQAQQRRRAFERAFSPLLAA